jgi:hypothetical protein
MVAPSEDAVGCAECHARDGRMNGIEGVYIPGRDAHPWIGRIALAAIGLLLLGIAGHALVRVLFGRKGEHR